MNDSTTSIKVILADDHAVVRAGIRQFLEKAEDIEVVAEAGDGETAIGYIEKFNPDVAVLDIQMPKVSGIEVTRWIRSNKRDIGVLVLTAFDDDPYVMAVLQAGANGYVLKTASPLEILQAVRDVHAGNSAMDPVIMQKMLAQISRKHDEKPIDEITDRELEVLTLVAQGFTNKAIGIQLGISDRTVQGHLAHIFSKLHADSRTEAVTRAISLGWISPEIGNMEQR